MHFIKSHEIPPFTTIVADSRRFQQNGVGGFGAPRQNVARSALHRKIDQAALSVRRVLYLDGTSGAR